MKKQKAAHIGPNAELLPRDEWDFSALPRREAHECLAYELARSAGLGEHVEKKRAELGLRAGFTFDEAHSQMPEKFAEMGLIWFWPEFPTKAYLSVPKSERERRAKQLDAQSDDDRTIASLCPQFLSEFYPINVNRTGGRMIEQKSYYVLSERRIYPIPDAFALLRIDWKLKDERLVESFRVLLRRYRPTKVSTHRWRGSGDPVRASLTDLKKLAAWRLVRAANSWEEAYVYSREKLGKALYSSHPKAWRVAAAGAESLMEEFAPQVLFQRDDQ